MRHREYYIVPDFLAKKVKKVKFKKWLFGEAFSHHVRDGKEIELKIYRQLIYEAVINSDGKDFYTREKLDWTKISIYDGKKVKRKGLLNMPRADHNRNAKGEISFKICSWQTRDCKNDLTIVELKRFCRLILKNKLLR
jgi:hypothetical protein